MHTIAARKVATQIEAELVGNGHEFKHTSLSSRECRLRTERVLVCVYVECRPKRMDNLRPVSAKSAEDSNSDTSACRATSGEMPVRFLSDL